MKSMREGAYRDGWGRTGWATIAQWCAGRETRCEEVSHRGKSGAGRQGRDARCWRCRSGDWSGVILRVRSVVNACLARGLTRCSRLSNSEAAKITRAYRRQLSDVIGRDGIMNPSLTANLN